MNKKGNVFKKFLKGEGSSYEFSSLMQWLELFRHPDARTLSEDEINESLARFENSIQKKLNERPLLRYMQYAAVAVLLSFLTFGIYYFAIQSDDDSETLLAAVGPAEGKAILTLSNGDELAVGAHMSDTLLTDYGVQVLQDEAHGLTIAQGGLEDNDSADPLLYHTVKTPYGGVVRLQLEDGTVVDLNSGSTVRFPNTFKGNANREIYLDGEALLTVQRNEKKPFIVRTAQQSVEVLGTRFCINTQDVEMTKTTLEEGSVRVFSSIDPKITLTLKPGEQALSKADELRKIKVNLDKELDWKNNDFYFEDSPIDEVMRKIARWYDVDVTISPSKSKVHLTGIISRQRSLKEVLHFLSQTEKMTYKLKERRLYVD